MILYLHKSSSNNPISCPTGEPNPDVGYTTVKINHLSEYKCIVPMIYFLPTIVAPASTQNTFDVSFDNVPMLPSRVLFTALRACVHIPSAMNVGSESLFNPFTKVLVSF